MNYSQAIDKLNRQQFTWLITGCAGFIGTNLAKHLLNHNQKVIGLDNFISGKHANIDYLKSLANNNFTFIEGDLRDYPTCQKITEQADYILHQAALGSIPRSFITPLLSHDCNVNGFLNLIEASRHSSVKRFVFASSSSVYGDNNNNPKLEKNIGKALAPYPLTKQICELYAQNYQKCFSIETIGLRYFNVFGQHQTPDGDYAAVIPKWINQLLNKQGVEIYGDGETSRDFTYIENVIQANILAALTTDPQAINKIYNIACQATTSLNQLLELIQQQLKLHLNDYSWQEPIYKDFRRGDTTLSLADINLAKKHLNYAPTHTIKQGLQQAITWYIEQVK